MRSCCKQVREFLDFGKHLHAAIHELYQRLDDRTQSERLHLLLEYLERHERHLQQSLSRFEKDSRSGLLEAWLEYSPTLDVEAVIAGVTLGEQPSSDDLIRAAMAFDDALIAVYREVSEKAVNPKVRSLFEDLLRLEESEKQKVGRLAMSLLDM